MNTYHEPVTIVFGAAGYIGSWVVRSLIDEGYRVKAFDCYLFGNSGLIDLSHPNLEIIEGNICDILSVSRAIRGADCVIFLSAIVGSRFADIQNPQLREVNLLASSAVLDAAIEHGVSRFIFASTDSVYGAMSGLMYETATPEPISLYSRLKLRMEERVIRAKSRYFHPTALRIATCYGYSPRMRFDLVPNALIRDAVRRNKITIKAQDSCRAFIHVKDAATAVISCAKAHINLVSGEVFNVGSNEQNATIKHLANIVSSMCPWIEVVLEDEEPDLVDYRLSCVKIRRLLDFVPEWTFEHSMEDLKERLSKGEFDDPYNAKYCNT